MPFAFRSAEHAHHAMDGPLGAYLTREMEANGIHGFPVGAFDNGMRQISINSHPVVAPDDLVGIRMRTPAAPLIADTFKAFGAQPVTINSDSIYAALKEGRVDAQENPLALIELFKLYEVVSYISVTNHIWSGFNELAHLATWRRLPGDIKNIIDRNVATHVRRQRQEQAAFNAQLRVQLSQQGPTFNDVSQAPFRARLSGVYAKWRHQLGTKCWSLLEAETGRLA
jgi:tripartite ATP-independent transporter DctP family solute receptor